MITWKDIKYTTLQKMFSITGSATTIPNDSATMEYVNAMPAACNEALLLLSTAGKFIIKEYDYINYPAENLLGKNTFKTYTVTNDILEFAHADAKSYYFKISGKPVSCKLYVGEEEVLDFYPETEEEDTFDYHKFTTFKGNITFPEVTLNEGEELPDQTPRIVIIATTPCVIQNMCFYPCAFEEVPDYEEFIKLKMSELVPDFYQLAPAEMYDLGISGNEYIVADKYFQEADKTLVIPREKAGIYVIHYRAYPAMITLATPDDYEMPLDPEVAALLPLYMASELYKDDDNAIATTYRNEAELGREALSNGPLLPKKEKFVTDSGWA